jgi:hypothetical protein
MLVLPLDLPGQLTCRVTFPSTVTRPVPVCVGPMTPFLWRTPMLFPLQKDSCSLQVSPMSVN